MMDWSGGGMMGFGGGFLGGVLVLIVYALAVVGVVALVRGWRGGGGFVFDRPSSEQILDDRFARGEIDIEEYTRRRDLLRSQG